MSCSISRIAVLAVLIAAALVIIAGCGGGGGSAPSANHIITGEVRDTKSTDTVISNAVVTIGSKSTKTDSQGKFRLEFDTIPSVTTWSVDGTEAKPDPGYFDFWARMGIVTTVFDARALPMPAITGQTYTMPTVYLWNMSQPPPPL